MEIILIYYGLINLVTFCTFAIDKRKAIKKQWRISEACLLLLSLIGGALGALIAMYTIRHKNRKIKFTLLVPVMLVAHIALFVVLF